MVDAELIELGHRYILESGVSGAVAHLNSIGDAVCRPLYRQALLDYFTPLQDRLSDDSRRRLQVNPLRVLDDRLLDPELAAGAPRSIDHLCDPCREHFDGVLRLLDAMVIRYEIDPGIVRGLDYYTRTTFEFFVEGREGQQQALAGGGRYDGLAQLLGGRPTPGIGFGLGIDRVALAAAEAGATVPVEPLVAVLSADPEAMEPRLAIAAALREAGLRVRPDTSSRKLGKQLESAAKLGARWAVIIGAGGELTLRDLDAGTQAEETLARVVEFIKAG
jgi:histidyl-tRNA synthetase